MKSQIDNMTTESEIYESNANEIVAESGFYDFKLLRTTTYAMLYRARKAGKYFLVKTTKDNSERQLSMLRREYELSIGCDHSNIVHIYTFEKNMSVGAGIIMEYIEGFTLSEYLAKNPTVADCNRIFEELLSCVGYLHKRGIIHNDLKPENILITRTDNTLKLIDFGLADNDAQFAMRTLGCTPQYASHELRAQSSKIDARSDIYSIGMIMTDIFQQKYRTISKRCLNINPDKRYGNTTAIQLAWRHRHRPTKVILSILASIIFILPLILFGHTKFTEYNETKMQEQLFTKIECDVKDIYANISDSISRAVYYEFANNHIVSFWEEVATYQKRHISTISDAKLNALATYVYTSALNLYHNSLQEQAKTLPTIPKDEMAINEQMFYYSLLEKRQPYCPFSAE